MVISSIARLADSSCKLQVATYFVPILGLRNTAIAWNKKLLQLISRKVTGIEPKSPGSGGYQTHFY